MRAKVEQYIKKSPNNGEVLFLGPVSYKKRDFLMNNAIMTVITSRKETMSMGAMESSLVGTPF